MTSSFGRRFAVVLVGAATVALSLGTMTALAGDGELVQPIDFTHNGVDAPAPVSGTAWSSGPAWKPGVALCSTTPSNAANVNTDCDITGDNQTDGPHNETSVAVNPTNTNNIIVGANDYQLSLNPGGHVGQTLLSFAHVSTDGGKTWSMYPVNANSTYQATGDPALAFDATGRAYYATLGFRFVGPTNAQSPDILVSDSSDGGKTWHTSRVAEGSGVFTSVGDLLDKEFVAAWGNGNAIVTFGDFRLGHKGAFVNSKIYASVTHNGGASWSAPTLISGSLEGAFVSVPTVTADGRVFVGFLNTADLVGGRDDVVVVQVNPATGARIGSPMTVTTAIPDGFTDYPLAFGRQTYQDSVFRSWAAGNITADPTNANHLAVVWSDMRNSTLPAPANPYATTTDSDVIVSQSTNGGQTWSAPLAVARAGDQFMPWGVYDTSGKLRIGFFDRSYDAANHRYGYTLATETTAGSLSFGFSQLTTALSNPTSGTRWFARNVNPNFPRATAFLGDYSGIAAHPNGGIVASWTDLREQACFGGLCATGEDAYFAAAP